MSVDMYHVVINVNNMYKSALVRSFCVLVENIMTGICAKYKVPKRYS